MRKKLIFLTLLLFSLSFYSQSKEEIEKHQNKWITEAKEELIKNDLLRAFMSYGFAKDIDSLTQNGIFASKKYDSIKIILRKKLIQKIKGTWKWKNTGSNWGISKTNKESLVEKILIINESYLSFYEVNKKTKKTNFIKREKLTFNNIPGMLPSYHELVYSNKQIWSYNLKNEGIILHLTNTGEIIDKNSRNEIVCGNTELIYERIK